MIEDYGDNPGFCFEVKIGILRCMENLKIAFIALQERHLPSLLTWLETGHVKDWWDQDVHWTSELVKEKYGSYVHGYKIEDGIQKPLQAFIICIDDIEIGYIQLYNAHEFAREGGISLNELPRSLAACDIFIGDPTYVGKGYGTALMKKFLQDYVDPKYEACFVDPDTANTKAIRAYEKAGFEKIKTIQNGTVTWMIRNRPAG